MKPYNRFASVVLCAALWACRQSSAERTSGAEPTRVLSSVQLAPEARPAGTKAHRPDHPLRLATWNLQWLDADIAGGAKKRSQADYEKLGEYAERLDADVIAVQEVENEQAVYRVFSPDRYRVFLSARSAPQRTGFVVRLGLGVRRNPDLVELAPGQLRRGTDISVEFSGSFLRLLSVHLKSGCFSGALNRSKACRKLAAQVPHLERWIDERQRAGEPFVVMGDFNRRFFQTSKDEVWSDLDDGDPRGLVLWSPTKGRHAHCNQKHPDFIDHLVFNQTARALMRESSFVEHSFDARDAAFVLSDHCPLSVELLTRVEKAPLSP